MSSTLKNTSIKSLFILFKKSLSGENADYTSGSIRKAIFLLSIPMILEMCMESVFAVVDIFFVGRIGKDAVATVALTESVLTLVYSVAIGLSMAATAIVARRIGEKNPEEASKSAMQAILISLVMTVIISITGFLLAPNILEVMGAPKEVVETGASYTRIIFGGSIVIMMLYLINGIFRGAGNASIAMWSLWVANGLNIILCPLLIHYYGVKGAAMATTIGRGAGVCFQLYHLFKGSGALHLLRKYFTPDWEIISGLLKIAWTGTAQFIIGSASWIALARIIAAFNDTSIIAGYQVAIRILLFFLLPAWGLSNATATLVGQNLGAKQPQRAEQSVWKTAKYNAIFMAFVSLLFLIASKPIVDFMNPDPSVQNVAIEVLHIVTAGYIFYGVGMVLMNAFNGAGDTVTPTVISLFCFWAFQVPIAYLMAIPLKIGPRGVFFAIIIAETAVTIVSFIIFRRGNWKKVKV
ncbi:MAG: MATE family efflux transporter [Bacteroidetes bacterium]|nr:MATE family efflux transporter [Bacteroidota bacterium]MBS1932769.1 MATE family efflux transporter [Bacteroidota bacterium]